MDKTNKELAVELAKYVVLASVLKNNDSTKKAINRRRCAKYPKRLLLRRV